MGKVVAAHELDWALAAVSVAAGALALALAVIVLFTDRRRRLNRRLAAVLAADGLLMGLLASTAFGGDDAGVWENVSVNVVLTTVSVAYVCFLGVLDTPLTRPLRRRGVLVGVLGVIVALLALDLWVLLRELPDVAASANADLELPWPVLAVTSLAALVATIVAYRRAEPGSSTRRRAGFFALAFGARDVLYAGGILSWGFFELIGRSHWNVAVPFVLALGVVLFAALLAYGILQSQLFDIDLKIKRGISRSTVAAFGIAFVLVAAKITEFYLNSTVGIVAGGIMAGLVLFLSPRLNKLGDRVADTAMPKVQATSSYLEFKKMEVYRAAIESALEGDGRIDAAERAMLDRLRAKLGIAADDAGAMERELAEPSGAASA